MSFSYLEAPKEKTNNFLTRKDTETRLAAKVINKDACRYFLAQQALENAQLLSVSAENAATIAPDGAHRYKLIADMYTAAAAYEIANFGEW